MLIPFCRVVQHHVQYHVNAIGVQGADELLQLCPFPVVFHGSRISRIWREKAYGIVSPVIQKLFAVHNPLVGVFVKFENRHQLYGVDPQLLEVRDFFH